MNKYLRKFIVDNFELENLEFKSAEEFYVVFIYHNIKISILSLKFSPDDILLRLDDKFYCITYFDKKNKKWLVREVVSD